MAKEMLLVDPSILETAQCNKFSTLAPNLQNIKTRVLKESDNQIRSTLDNDMLNPSEKLLYYNQALMRHDNYTHGKTTPTGYTPNEDSSTVKTEKQYSIDNEIIDSVPTTLTTKTKNLLRKLKQSNIISWDDQGNFVYKGQVQPNTNIVDIVNDIVRDRKTNPAPKGWQLVAQGIKELNLPNEIVKNQRRYNTAQLTTPQKPKRTHQDMLQLLQQQQQKSPEDDDQFVTPTTLNFEESTRSPYYIPQDKNPTPSFVPPQHHPYKTGIHQQHQDKPKKKPISKHTRSQSVGQAPKPWLSKRNVYKL